MTDTPAEVEAARALVAAYDALNSPEHQQEAERLRELSLRVSSRVDAFQAAQKRIQGLHAAACANGTPAADNTEAAQVLTGYKDYQDALPPYLQSGEAHRQSLEDADTEITDLTHLYAEDDDKEDEYQTARAAGAYTDN